MQDEFSSFREQVGSALSEEGVQMRSMFGGFGLVKDGQLIGLLYKNNLYLRTHPETRPEYESRGMREYRAFGRPAKQLQGYMQVPPEVVEDPSELKQWTTAAAGVWAGGESPPMRTVDVETATSHELPREIRKRR